MCRQHVRGRMTSSIASGCEWLPSKNLEISLPTDSQPRECYAQNAKRNVNILWRITQAARKCSHCFFSFTVESSHTLRRCFPLYADASTIYAPTHHTHAAANNAQAGSHLTLSLWCTNSYWYPTYFTSDFIFIFFISNLFFFSLFAYTYRMLC